MLAFLAAAETADDILRQDSFTTNDGVELRYVSAGTGKPIVFVHGWSHSAKVFIAQLTALRDRYRVFALDQRGHGYSDKPAHGMRVSRLAVDLHEFLTHVDVHDAILVGHGMGAAVLWCYWDMFGAERIGKLVCVDQSPLATANPNMTEDEMKLAGSNFDLRNLYSEMNGLSGINGGAVTEALIRGMVSRRAPRDLVTFIVSENFRLPRKQAAQLLYDWATCDWRDTIPRITVPTLCIGAKASPVPCESQTWIREHIPGAELLLFEEAEGGSHFMFMENPQKFNDAVAAFVG